MPSPQPGRASVVVLALVSHAKKKMSAETSDSCEYIKLLFASYASSPLREKKIVISFVYPESRRKQKT